MTTQALSGSQASRLDAVGFLRAIHEHDADAAGEILDLYPVWARTLLAGNVAFPATQLLAMHGIEPATALERLRQSILTELNDRSPLELDETQLRRLLEDPEP